MLVRYVLRRILLLALTLVSLALLVFVISHLLPGDPVRLAAGPNATAAEVESVRHEFGFDRPLYQQFLGYAGGLLRGDWGVSIFTRHPVGSDLISFLPATLELVIAAFVLALLIGIPGGLVAAIYRNRWPDVLTRSVSIAGVSMPRFFIGLLLQLAFATWLDWLPLSGRFPLVETPPPQITGLYVVDALLTGDLHACALALQYLVLPSLALALAPAATIMRIMRASTMDVLRQDYVLTERALGLPRRLIIGKYVLRNALSATLTVAGLYFGWLLGGTVLVETVFDWPGIGLYATEAILNQDFMPIAGVTLCVGAMFALVNLVVDVLQAMLNPKVRLS